jgi:hypothetical protein
MKYYIEHAKSPRDEDGKTIIAEVREASEEEIKEFKSKECNHSSQDLLIYDEKGWLYDARYCGVCNKCIGLI